MRDCNEIWPLTAKKARCASYAVEIKSRFRKRRVAKSGIRKCEQIVGV